MITFWIEADCPHHGFERFQVKVIKKFNMPSSKILPKIQSKPKPGEISYIVVGRDVRKEQVEDYLVNYLHEAGLWKIILSIRAIEQ